MTNTEQQEKGFGTKLKEALFTPKFSLRNVILSLLLGFAVAYLTILVIYGAEGANYIIKSIFVGDFYDSKSISKLLDKVVILGFAGMAVLVGMKAGLLNIGVSGQMMFGAFVGYFVVRQMDSTSIPVILTVGFLVTVSVSAFVSLISGLLKAYFKVNEVISTIMMNWIVVYLMKFLASNKAMDWYNSNSVYTIDLAHKAGEGKPHFTTPITGELMNSWYLAILGAGLFVISALIMWFLFAKTRYGFKVQSTGISASASEYAGYNAKLHQILAMTISGAFAGMAGFAMYFLSKNTIVAGDAPINEGFAGIAVTLVAMNNPLALPLSAIVFGLLDGPTDGIIFGAFPSSIVQIFAGVITYFVAITTLWLYLRPIEKIKAYKARRSDALALEGGH